MAFSEKETFKFTWQIENFSFCPLRVDEKICSPNFVVDFLPKSVWKLSVYPNGAKENENYLNIFLNCEDPTVIIAIGFTLSLLSVTGKKWERTQNQLFDKNYDWGCTTFCSREILFNPDNGYLPNDTLTLTCEMWKVTDDADEYDIGDVVVPDCGIPDDCDLLKQMHATVARDEMLSFQNHVFPNQCLAITRIRVENKWVLWPIRRISQLNSNKKLTFPVITASNTTPPFFLTLYVNDDECLRIEIQMHPNENKMYFVRCKIVAFYPMSNDRFIKEDEYFFQSEDKNEVWKFPDFVDFKKIKKFSNSNLDVMYFRCEFAFSSPAHLLHNDVTDIISVSSRVPFPTINNSTASIVGKVSKDNELSDVILRIEDQDFKAHKIILVSQSSVFKAMFQNDMLEKKNSVVDIRDIDKQSLSYMLDFINGDDLKIADTMDVVKLYAAADKYNILPLMWFCSCFLKSNLSVSNAVSVMTLLNLHKDDDLMNETKNFILLHSTEIFHSQAWIEFINSNSELARDFMLTIRTNL